MYLFLFICIEMKHLQANSTFKERCTAKASQAGGVVRNKSFNIEEVIKHGGKYSLEMLQS